MFLQISDHALARLEAVEISITWRRLFVGAGVDGENVDLRQTVAFSDDVIVEVVGGRDFQRAAAELGVHVLIGNDGYAPPGERKIDIPANQVPVAFIVGMNGHRRVAEHCFGSRGRHHHVFFSIGDRIADVPKKAILFLRDHLQIGNSRVQHRVPVDEPLATIDEPIVVEANERFPHGM